MLANAKWVIGTLLVLQAMFVGSTFNSSLVTIVYAAIASLMVYARRRREDPAQGDSDRPSSRSLKWLLRAILFTSVAAVTALWRGQTYVIEGINPMVVGVDAVAHSCLFIGWLVWIIRPRVGHVSLLPLGFIVLLLCVVAGGASNSLAGQTTVALCACIGFALASQAILADRGSARRVVSEPASQLQSGGRLRIAPLFSLLTLSAILIATSAIARATSEALPGIQNILHAQLKATLDSVATETTVGGTRYVRGSRLGSIRRHLLGGSNDVALKLYSPSAPGYLRGHAFDVYEDRRWYAATSVRWESEQARKEVDDRYVTPAGYGSTMLTTQTRRKLNRFSIRESSREGTLAVEIHNDPIKGPYVFMPLGTRWLEAASRQLTVSHHDTVVTGVDATAPYIAGVSPTPVQETLSGQRRELLLWVPPEIRPVADTIAAQLCDDELSAYDKAEAISRYFQKEYQYSLAGMPVPPRTEPLVYFLESRHPAHCEYFASATVMLLRSLDVPARYVTGYVAIEQNDDEEFWIARNRDAHAWVEAYDDASQQWFPVESTPGRTYRSLDFGNADLNTANQLGTEDDSDGASDRSWIGQIWGWMMSMRATDPLIVIFRIAQLPLFCVLAFLIWRRFGRASVGSANPIDVQSRRLLRQVDRRMRKHTLVRLSHETLHQFANRIEERLQTDTSLARDQQTLQDAAAWYRQYADARYRGYLPAPFAKPAEDSQASEQRLVSGQLG